MAQERASRRRPQQPKETQRLENGVYVLESNAQALRSGAGELDVCLDVTGNVLTGVGQELDLEVETVYHGGRLCAGDLVDHGLGGRN